MNDWTGESYYKTQRDHMRDLMALHDGKDDDDARRAADDLGVEVGDDEAAQDALHEYALGVSERRVFEVLLTIGGPAAWLEVSTSDGEIDKVAYRAEWSGQPGITRILTDDDPLARYAAFMVEPLLHG